jgi:hypothetical protein
LSEQPKPPVPDEQTAPLAWRLMWFIALWILGVTIFAVVAYAIRAVMKA